MEYSEISSNVVESLRSLHALNFVGVLQGYRVIRDITDLDMGKHVRWIRHSAPSTLTTGGIMVDIRDNNMVILCISKKIISVNFSTCVVFQKLSPGEILVSMAYDEHK